MQTPETTKPKRTRIMTPELLDKLKMARERATELRLLAKEQKANLPDTVPHAEKSKVAKYLATRKVIKDSITQDVLDEMDRKTGAVHEIPLTPHQGSPNNPLPIPSQPTPAPAHKKEAISDDDDEYTTIKIPKKKIIKWKQYAEREPEPVKQYGHNSKNQFNPYTTNHLINLAMGGYSFK